MGKTLKEFIPKEFLEPSGEFRSAMESMDINWWYWDVVNKCILMSPRLIEILGYTPEEFDPTIPTLDKNIHPDDSIRNKEIFKDFIDGGTPVYEIEYRLKRNGTWKWYYNRGAIMKRNEKGEALFAGGITMDISTQFDGMMKRLEESSKFEFIFRNTNQPVVIALMGEGDQTGSILEVNEAASELFGETPDTLRGKDPYELIDRSFYERRSELRKELKEKGNLRLDLQMTDTTGRTRYMDIRSHALTLTGRDLFISILTDKTEAHRVMKELAASELALRQSEKVYRSLIMAANDRIGLFETDGTPALINNAFYATLGFTEEEFMALDDKERMHPDDKMRMKSLIDEFYKNGSLTTEYRVRHKDGHYLYMNSKSVLLQDPELEKDYILYIIRDVTDSVEFGKKLIEAKEKAEESDKLKSAFLANMSHEIRTPMNSIVGFANLLSEKKVDEASREEYVSRINSNSRQLLALISDIVDLAKIESNQLSVIYTIVYLDNLFVELMQYGETQLKLRNKENVALKYDPDPGHPDFRMETDLIRLTQILQNLLNNAIKFTGTGEIVLGYRVEDEKVRFFVSDTGTGIDSKNFDIIFDQFRQIDGSHVRKYGGTGLGLAICRNLSNLLHGKIWVESTLGEGSTFHLELPVVTGMKIEEDPLEKDAELHTEHRVTVLVADDDPDSLLLLRTILRNEGIHTVPADSGYSTLEVLEREQLPDLVMMDLQMPVLSGEQTLRIIRENYPGLKVIAQSARAFEDERERELVAGFDGHVSKPYSREKIMETIRRVLAK